MKNRRPIEYTGKVLDQRNTLTGPDTPGEEPYPERPEHVSIQQKENKGIK